MKVGKARVDDKAVVVGTVDDDRAIDLSRAAGLHRIADAVVALLQGQLDRFAGAAGDHDIAALELEAPIDDDARILCAGFNYRDHATEADREAPTKPTFFTRLSSSLVGAGAPVVRSAIYSIKSA